MTTIDPDTLARPSVAALDRQSARQASSAVMAMVLFVASEAVFFSSFLGIYASAYAEAAVWPPNEVPLPTLMMPTIGLGFLLASGITMGIAMYHGRRGTHAQSVSAWLFATLVFSLAFVAITVLGYRDLGFGIGQGIYESLFYIISALALAHLAGGLVLIGLVLARARHSQPAQLREPLLATGIYWYFVLVLGVVIYLLLYLVVAA